VGDANRIAYSGVQAVVERPGRITPLFLYGPSGTGKSHLLEGIASVARRERGLRRVVLLSAEEFTSSFLDALRGGGLPSFRRKYRDVEMLLIDDLQFFSGKSATIIEVQYTVDSLLRAGRQLVLAADRSPSELGSLGGELIGRISGGLVCGIEPADEATRLGIARREAARHGVRLPEEVLQLIAARVSGDARLIAGALNRLVAASEALRRPIDQGLAETSLGDFFRMTRRVVQLDDIETAVCDVFGIDNSLLQSGRKNKGLSQPRMLAMWLARKYTRAAFAEIGQYFGRRAHSTVISAQRQVESWVADGRRIQLGGGDCDVRDAIRRVESRLGAG
jgi:chromosomal replication initiator protein